MKYYNYCCNASAHEANIFLHHASMKTFLFASTDYSGMQSVESSEAPPQRLSLKEKKCTGMVTQVSS